MSGRFLECIKGYASSSVVMLTHPSCPHCPHYLWILCIEGESERESGREGERVGEREGARATETQSVCVFSFTLNPSKLCLQSVLINWALHILNLAAMWCHKLTEVRVPFKTVPFFAACKCVS